MAEERKKPKIDLKTRIPSKTVKGLAPAGGGGVIPPPPGAVPAPPPDLLGRRSDKPKVTVDPNDPLGAATVSGAPPPQQIVVVADAQAEGVGAAASKKGGLIAIVAGVLIAGGAIGFLVGKLSTNRDRQSKAVSAATDLKGRIDKTQKNLQGLDDLIGTALSQLDGNGIADDTIAAIKSSTSGFSEADLAGGPGVATADLAYFGSDRALKIVRYAEKVKLVDELRAGLTGGAFGVDQQAARIKALTVPNGQTKYGVVIQKAGDKDPPVTIASLRDFGDPVDLKALKVDDKTHDGKLDTKKNGSFDINPAPKDFFGDKQYVSVVPMADWFQLCAVRTQSIEQTRAALNAVKHALEGGADKGDAVDKGAIDLGKDVLSDLQTISKG